ncbi:MAG: hypothetical protein CME64_06280 [Halobacteriovoraceae bacterium]|nr:hypothetical protein [Halobacteriovoraceae bacterium]|tara:strand:- start:91603 stop:93189 length:1587 start_codon:yes stop_codon:yes gene_type:complete
MLKIFTEPYIALFVIMMVGVALSKLSYKRIGLGSSAIVIVAIIFGHFGIQTPQSIEKIGLILFIFSVGIEAGPGFFQSFKTGEVKQYILPILVTMLSTFTLSLLASKIFGLDSSWAVGLFAGINTSTPTLAAAIDNGANSTALLSYTIAYPLALISSIVIFRALPSFIKINVDDEEKDYREKTLKHFPVVKAKSFLVENPNIANRQLNEINLPQMTGAFPSRIQGNEEESQVPGSNTVINLGDKLKIIGDEASLSKAELVIGRPVLSEMPLAAKETVISILVTSPVAIGKSLAQLNLNEVWNAEVTKIRRAGINLAPNGKTRLRYGDKLQITLRESSVDGITKMLGGKESTKIDFLPIAASISLGVAIGQITIQIGDGQIGPGITGGILFATLLLGQIGKTGSLLWSIAGPTNQFLRQLGMMLFLCGIGTNAGQSIASAFESNGPIALGSAFAIILISILFSSIVCLKVFKMNKLQFLGAMAGALTCSAALPDSEDIKSSTVPATSYSIAYPFSLLLTIFLGQVFLIF